MGFPALLAAGPTVHVVNEVVPLVCRDFASSSF
jgi:hypothetical protein